ncbi:hypothetical protein QTI66_01385 [Variovorax sp. J22R133]|uniref:hypothetical protein n=1 Tax=Variovorax brevis TaxID=3053503 RepID=UPI0025789A54|nr:hypothetical protein [Variovorax sp. J22R133]MDM0110778.1 hypothetical protein [Variovorax sp. J22R133]
MSAPEPRRASIWSRFWSPKGLLEQVPPGASAGEAEAVYRRNDIWLKTYMDMYILRWGALWATSLAVALVLMDEPGLLFFLALALNLTALVGLIVMVMVYRRASRAVRDRIQDDGRR